MNPLKRLAGQTAIYGLSSIIGRLLNYLLVPLHTRVFAPEQFGIITEMYAYVAFLLIVLTYGFETAYFRFSSKEGFKDKVFSTSMISLLISSAGFLLLCVAFAQPIANAIQYPNHSEYVIWFAMILAADAVTAVPFSKLRFDNKPIRFALIKIIGIAINIGLNVFFIWLCPLWYAAASPEGKELMHWFFNPETGVGYVFIANLLASLATLLLLSPTIIGMKWKFDKALWKEMFRYAFPLLISGLAGITNEMFSRTSMKYQLPEDRAMYDLGIFGACYKVAILMTLFIQTFRFAAEPFFFAQAKEKDAKQLYADVMKYFVMICSIIFLGIMIFIDVVSLFIDKAYHEGLSVVPILLMANVFLGIFFNLSIWFKLNDKTHLGAWLAIMGAAITVILNYWWIPLYSYQGAAWATFVVYFIMMMTSYFLGRKYYPVPYEISKIIAYPLAAYLVYYVADSIINNHDIFDYILRSLILLIFIGAIVFIEKPKKLTSPRQN
ncbi:MAG: lipopolysaccharide biosynthesis protein [Flavobacteriales bacterium]